MDNDDLPTVIIVGVLLCLVAFFCGGCVGDTVGRDHIRREARDAKAGHWEIDENDNKVWKWGAK